MIRNGFTANCQGFSCKNAPKAGCAICSVSGTNAYGDREARVMVLCGPCRRECRGRVRLHPKHEAVRRSLKEGELMDIIGTIGGKPTVLTFDETYQPGDQPPKGYIAWHSWASVQHKAGLRQARCGVCCKWHYPQELSHVRMPWEATDSKGNVRRGVHPVCNECAGRSLNERG